MKNGLKIYEKFEKLYLEVCVPEEHREKFEKEYSLRANENPKNADGYNSRNRKRKYNAWGIEFRVYFKTTTSWVISSLEKLGYHTEISNKLIAVEFSNAHPDHDYQNRVTNKDLFWKLIEYGYRLGENLAIPYSVYEMKKELEKKIDQKVYIVPMLDINFIESENPVYEAKMLMGV